MTQSERRLFAILIPPCWGMVAYALWLLAGVTWEAHQSVKWPTTSAAIVSSVIGQKVPSHARFSPEITYLYKIGTERYIGHRIGGLALPGRQEKALAVVQQYPVGSTVRVHVSPKDPRAAFLQPGITYIHIAGLGLLTTLTLLPLWFLIRLWKCPSATSPKA